MEAKRVVVQKEIEVVTKKLVDETSVTLTLTEEEARNLRTLCYTVGYRYAKENTVASAMFNRLYATLCRAGVQQALNSGCNFEHEFVERK